LGIEGEEEGASSLVNGSRIGGQRHPKSVARVAFMGGQSEKLRRRERHCIIIQFIA
jgi:hypothetical protein